MIGEKSRQMVPVELTNDERGVRARQATRLSVALRAHQERAKEQKKALADEEKRITKALHAASDAAENGTEERAIEVCTRWRGAMIETYRVDTGEQIGIRSPTAEELESTDDVADEPAH